MIKPKGVWLRPTELGEVAEATVAEAPHSANLQPAIKQTAATQKRYGSRPLLVAALLVCCSLLTGLIGLRVYSTDFPLFLPRLIEPVSASQIIPEDLQQGYMVRVLADGREYKTECYHNTVAEALHLVGVEIGSLDEVSLPLDMIIETDVIVEVRRGQYLYINTTPEEEAVVLAQTDELVQPVVPPSRPLVEQPVLSSRSGDSADSGDITVGEETFAYARRLSMESTAYTWTGYRTATGTWPAVGTIAVDPQFIPLGSKVYVDGYGFAIAEDTGRLIKGNIIDVYFETRDECIKWGRRRGVTVYILE